MNSKVLLAFIGGLVIASGVTYIALRQGPPAQPATAPASTPAAAPAAANQPQTAVQPQPAPEAPAPESQPAARAAAPITAEHPKAVARSEKHTAQTRQTARVTQRVDTPPAPAP